MEQDTEFTNPQSTDEVVAKIPPTTNMDTPRVSMVLGVQFLFSILLMVFAQMIFMAVAQMSGWDENLASGNIGADATPDERGQLRLLLGINNFFMYIVAGGATVWMFYRGTQRGLPHWADYLQIRQPPKALMMGLAILLMLCSMPLVLYVLQINKMLPLPDAFHVMEDNTDEMIKGLLKMEGWAELAANLTLIALIAGVGEELVFRGVLQQQLMRRIANPWVALALSAAIFSAIHLQFEGFLARWLLGMVLGWLYWRSRNLWVPIVAHSFYNALQVLAQYAYKKEMSTVDLEQDIQVPWQAALFSAFLMWAVMRIIQSSASAKYAAPEHS